jgi:hypothetical protein
MLLAQTPYSQGSTTINNAMVCIAAADADTGAVSGVCGEPEWPKLINQQLIGCYMCKHCNSRVYRQALTCQQPRPLGLPCGVRTCARSPFASWHGFLRSFAACCIRLLGIRTSKHVYNQQRALVLCIFVTPECIAHSLTSSSLNVANAILDHWMVNGRWI